MTPTADLLDRITINPNQCGGRPCIRGMRIRVSDVLAFLAAGQSQEEILETYPYLEADDITACILYAIREDTAGPSPPADFEVTPELRELLDARLREAEANPEAGMTWEEMKARLLKRG